MSRWLSRRGPDSTRSWKRANELFCSALEKPRRERRQYLDEACKTSPELRDYVLLLLTRYESSQNFLETPAAHLIPAQALTLDPGTILNGRFRIDRRIGEGGMGEVYASEDLQLSETVALKLLRPGLAQDPAAVRRFKLETQLARRVTHPNVCRIFDFAVDSGSPEVAFLTMELIEGRTLWERLRADGPFTERQLFPVFQQIVAGLQAAHEAGVIHRDLKPANVLLVERESHTRVVLTDFGLAQSQHESASDTTVLAGTPLYMAPEQLAGKPVSPATDVFALGLVTYEMFTGMPAAGASSLTQLIEAAAAGMSPRTVELGGVPSRWARIILKCVEPAPDDRFQSAAAVLAALERPVTVRRRALALVTLGLAGSAVYALAPRDPIGAKSDIPEADAAWQKGRLHARRLLPEDLRKAVEYFEQAVRLDPGFAAAWAALADAYSTLGDYGGMRADEAFDRARHAAERAVREGPNLAEAHASLGLALSLDPRRWTRAEPSFRRALELDPQHGPTHRWLGAHLARLGRTKEAISHTASALKADPASLPISVVLGWMYYFDRQWLMAIEQARKTVELDPNFLYGYVLLARACTETGDFEAAFEACNAADAVVRLGVSTREPAAAVSAARACIHAARGAPGDDARARELAAALERMRQKEHVPVHYIASIYSMLGDTDTAIQWLRRGFESSDPGVLYLLIYPPLHAVRSEARYSDLLRRLGIPKS